MGMAEHTTQYETERLAEQLLDAASASFELFSVYLGDRLGYYDALADAEPVTATELAAATGTDERYAREWLEHQAVAGVLRVADERASADDRRYALPEAHVPVLADADSLDAIAPLAQLTVGAVAPIHEVVDAYRTGAGVPFESYSPDLHEGQARMNRPSFLELLGTEWLPSLPDVHDRLLCDPPARVADVGCGFGWSCIGVAEQYPSVVVDGYDLDRESVVAARQNVADAGLADRVSVHHRDASDPEIEGDYDLVTAFECVHDMADPVGALTTMRRLAGEDGVVLVMDERVGDEFTADPGPVESLLYGFSVLHCLPVGRVDRPSAATGTVMRADTLGDYAADAGFSTFEVLPIENFFWRFYRLEA